MTLHKDPVARIVASVVLLAGVIGASVVGGWLASSRGVAPVDDRWTEYTQPTLVGVYDAEAGTVARDVTLDGVPVVHDNEVPVTFSRCGPVSEVEALSRRTWVITEPGEDAFLGIEGQTITIVIDKAACKTFELTYDIPAKVIAALEDAPDAEVSIRFTLDPVNPALGQVVIETEQFVRAEDVAPDRQPASQVINLTTGETS